jgi:hypothetical protein
VIDLLILAADAPTGGPSPDVTGWLQLLNIPVVGLLAYAVLTGKVVSYKEHQRVVDERDKEREERIKAQEALTEKALPVILETQRTLKDTADLVERLSRRR